MPNRNSSWGIEVGANAIKAMHLVKAGKGVEMVEYDILPFKRVLTTPDLDVDEAIQLNLDALLSRHEIDKSTTVVSVPGHRAFARFAKLPPVEPKNVPDIVQFEAVQQIPFPIDQVEWDYQVFQQEDSPDVEVGIFAITKERVANFLSNYRQMDMRIDALTLSPLAVYNAFAYENAAKPDEEQEEGGTIYMDIGASSTDVIIVENGGIWMRTLPIGGNNFTEAMVKAFKLSFSKAEKLKREASTSKYAKQIFQAMRPVFSDLVQEMQRSLGYYQSLNRDADLKRIVGVGSTFRLPGLAKFLKQQLQMKVIRPDGFERISAEGKQEADFAHHAINLSTAYGLALQGLGMEAVSANVLPSHILQARMWKAKQPWFAAAAACLAVAAGLSVGRYYLDANAWQTASTRTQQQVQPVLNRARTNVNDWQQAKGLDPRVRIENLRSILDYRDVWPKLLADLSDAAASMNPQKPTTSADYEKLTLPPGQRRRFYIDKVEVRYLVNGSLESKSQSTPGGTSAQVTLQKAIGSSYKPDKFFGSPDDPSKTPPRFSVTITGTTPHDNAASFITRHFIRWFEDNASRQDRPYRFVVDPQTTIVHQTKEPNPAATATQSQGGGGSNPGGNGWGRSSNTGAPGGFGAPQPGGYGGANQSSASNIGAGDLLPDRPAKSAPSTTVTEFTIHFTVDLLRPEKARQSQERRGPAPPTPPKRSEAAPASSHPQTSKRSPAPDPAPTSDRKHLSQAPAAVSAPTSRKASASGQVSTPGPDPRGIEASSPAPHTSPSEETPS